MDKTNLWNDKLWRRRHLTRIVCIDGFHLNKHFMLFMQLKDIPLDQRLRAAATTQADCLSFVSEIVGDQLCVLKGILGIHVMEVQEVHDVPVLS